MIATAADGRRGRGRRGTTWARRVRDNDNRQGIKGDLIKRSTHILHHPSSNQINTIINQIHVDSDSSTTYNPRQYTFCIASQQHNTSIPLHTFIPASSYRQRAEGQAQKNDNRSSTTPPTSTLPSRVVPSRLVYTPHTFLLQHAYP